MKIDPRYALWGALICILAILPAFAGFAGLGWEFAQAAGLVGCGCCVLLSGAPVRPRDAHPPSLLTLRLHTLIGWLALFAVALHIGGLVLSDPVVVEYLKPSAPLYQLAGVGASVVLLVVVLSGLTTVRRRLWSSHRGFQATHVILGCVLITLIAIHVIVTARYVGGPGRRAALLAGMIGGFLMLLRARRSGGRSGAGLLRHLVFGRNSTLIVAVATILATALAGLMGAATGAALREPLFHRAEGLPLGFPHSKHVAVNCITCHHNFADGRGFERCVECHQSSRPDLKQGVEARFHGFCFECHRHPDASLQRHGPVSGCASCHHSGATP